MFNGPQPGPIPKAPDPVRIPKETDGDILAARRTAMQSEFEDRRGRRSTMLDQAGPASPTYTRTTLG